MPFFIEADEDEDEDVFSSVGAHPDPLMTSLSPASSPQAPPALTSSAGIAGVSSTGAHPSISGAFSSVKVRAPDQLRARLALLAPDHQIIRELELHGSRFLIGGAGCDLHLEDPFISKWHAQIYASSTGSLMLEDLDSDNGVYLRIADEFVLEDNDEFLLGEQRFVFRQRTPAPRLFEPPREQPFNATRPLGGAAPKAFPHLIHVLEDGHIGGLYPMPDLLNIGQTRGELTCPSDLYMSPLHAFIERRHDKYYIHDAGSDFGTYVRVHGPIELLQGDCFVMGRTRMTMLHVG